jgi:hypothetical protein
MYHISDVSCLRFICCINAFIFYVHYLCLIGRVYVFYVGHVDKSSLYETLFHCDILSKHHHHRDTKLGEGATPVAGDSIRVHYTGWLDDFESEKKFDSSYDRRSPLVFTVGVKQVIKGYVYVYMYINVCICMYTCSYLYIVVVMIGDHHLCSQ